MTFELILAFNVALFASFISPGPALLLAIRTSLSHGRWAGIQMGCGLGLVAALWTLAALVGLDSIFTLFPWTYAIIKTVGAFYLIYIAWTTWRSAKEPISAPTQRVTRYFWQGALLNLSNPKSVLFSAAVLVVIFPPDLTLAFKSFIVFNQFLVEVIGYTIVAFVMSTHAVSKAYLRAKHWFDRFAAIVLTALGLRLLFQK